MLWYNYKAPTLHTSLNGNVILESKYLQEYIENYQAGESLYHCYYDLEKRSSFADYNGQMRPVFDTIHLDLDSKEDEGLAAGEDTKKICKRLQESGCSFHVYFSGNKGFHIAIHKSAFGITEGPKDEIEGLVKSVLFNLVAEYPTLDTGIWNANRKFRAFRSRHEKSGLYKIRLTGTDRPTKTSSLTLAEIRNLALIQPVHKYAHPEPVAQPVSWLKQSTSPPPQAAKKKTSVKELSQGQTIEDDSLRFKNFEHKKCIFKMQNGQVLPQFNRHDIEIVLAVDMRLQGKTLADAESAMRLWAERVYTGEPDRVEDCIRQLRDMYKKDLEANKLYQYGCYGDVKSAYCSAKCKLYDNLDRKKRAEAIDCSKGQRLENSARHNPNVELTEGQLADKILSGLPELCKASGQYFQWMNTHWKRIDGPQFEDAVTKSCIAAYNNEAGIRQIENLAKHILKKIPMAPETNHFFSASPSKFNFTDCTAEMIADVKGNLNLVTRPHNKKDFLAYCAPFPLKEAHNLPTGGAFKEYLKLRLDDLGEEGVRIIKQMLGAALIPYVPRIFFIEGVTNAGKSTLALLIKRLLGEENVESVQPVVTGMGGDRFNWTPTIGKLANIVLELDEKKPLDTTVLKMVRDKTSVSMDRKGRDHVKATLPFFHIYCCNQMPPSLEGNSGALNNRVTMLYFKPGYLNGKSGIVEYAQHIWMDDAGGVLEAAREGLADLIESKFKYYESSASKEAVKEWQKTNDSISLFFEDIELKEWRIESLEGKEWEKGLAIYDSFKMWCASTVKKPMGKKIFYNALKNRMGLECQERGKGGVLFRVPGNWICERDQNATPKSSMITDTLAY